MMGVAFHALPAAIADATRLALRLGLPVHEISLHWFPDGEMRVAVGPAAQTTILYGSLDRPNDKLLALLFATEALRREGARRLVLVAPYLCYMRQDAAFHEGESISQKVVGRLIAGVVERVITVDAHLHRTRDIAEVFPGIEANDLSAMQAIADYLRAAGLDPDTVVVGPDAESERWVSDLAGRLDLAHVVARKTRRSDRSVEITFADAKRLTDRPALLVDDIVSSGGTLITCAQALTAASVSSIDAIIIHALFSPELIHQFFRAGIRSVRSTNSVPHPTNAFTLDTILADALHQEIAEAAS